MILLSSVIVGFRDGTLVTFVKQNAMFQAPLLLWLLIARKAGMPRLDEMRLRAVQIVRRLRSEGASGETVAAPAPAIPRRGPILPAAVLRRRAALAVGPGRVSDA